ncbi:MAG: UDPGP type 1 family protein [Phycisphaerae bacterium]|nr:UDPGP type 1 family protein [Phycisphaerae bacterium]
MTAPDELRQKLQSVGQEHVLAFYDELPKEHQELLSQQIDALDFDLLNEWVETYVRRKTAFEIPAELQPPEIIPSDGGPTAEEARKRGEELLAAGKVAAFVVAGGQGTRLGYEGPKGCFPATPVVKKPLFRLFAEQIRAASIRHGVTIPWYILTSPTNDTATKAHFRQNDYWSFDPKDVIFVMQGTMPAIDFNGKLLLARKYRLAVSPDGHGGSITALRKSGALDDMAGRGIEHISYFQVDNPLVRVLDPLFIGLHDLAGAEMSAKALPKNDPMEKLGNFCVVDGKVNVIEYSDLPEDLARSCLPDGRLKFSAGSIAIHLFQRAFVERLTEGGRCLLPLHRADKKVPYVDTTTGQSIQPEAPNAVKLEMFVFDAFPLAEKTMLLETRRQEEFSPIKNMEGVDSLATSLHDQVRRWAKWLEAAGVSVPRDADGHVAAAIEISPLYADSADELAKKVDKTISISPGQNFYLGSRGQIGGA